MQLFVSLLAITLFISSGQCAKILGIFALGESHHFLAVTLMRGLADRGHDVTMITPIENKIPPKNGTFRNILLTTEDRPDENLDPFIMADMNFVSYQLFLTYFGNEYTEQVITHPNVQKLLKSEEKFDVVIVEQFLNDAFKAFAHHYKAHLVLFSTFGSNAWINPLVANPAPPSYVAEQLITFDHRNFCDRLRNFIIYLFGELNRNLLYFPVQNKIMKKHFPDAPDLDVLLYNASLILLNSHISTNKAVPRVPSMVDIGGFHLNPPKKLPQDLQEYLDNAKEGVIYFSMGSNLKSAAMDPEKRTALLKAFAKRKEKVLWKWEEEVLPGQPANVKLGKWLPQQDILAHPNIKLFITHGGLLSLTESVYHGVPILALPVFGDQQINAAEAASNGFGLFINYIDITEEKLSSSINELLTNPQYYDNMKERSRIMHDRQIQPLDDANYWINYVIKYRGAPHLRVDGLDLVWYKYLSIDVITFLLGCFFLTIYLSYIIVKTLLAKLCNKKKLKTN